MSEAVTETGSDPMASVADNRIATPKPVPRADVDPVFKQQLESLRTQADAEQTARMTGGQAKHMMPEKGKWTGSLFDYEGMALAFDRSQSHTWFEDATKDASSPGTTGDLAITTLQADYLACMERAFRCRHTFSRPRAMAHAMGRKRGHGNARGPLIQGVLEYVNGLVKDSKTASGNNGG